MIEATNSVWERTIAQFTLSARSSQKQFILTPPPYSILECGYPKLKTWQPYSSKRKESRAYGMLLNTASAIAFNGDVKPGIS